jgi:ABC-type transport system involved in multi-copper enzyme maturation permease subunit
MISVVAQTLYEAMRRRLGVTLLVMSVVLPALIVLTTPMELQPDGTYNVYSNDQVVPYPAQFVAGIFSLLARLGSSLWIFLCVCVGAGLLSTYLERGWAEVLFAKGQPRWRFLLGRYGAVLLLFAVTMSVIIAIPSAFYGRAGSAILPPGLWKIVALLTLSFSSVAATAAFITVSRAGMALPIIACFLQISIAGALQDHKAINQLIDWAWLRHTITSLYWILPKHPELGRAAASIDFQSVALNTSQVWTSLAFTAVVLGCALYRLHRKPL